MADKSCRVAYVLTPITFGGAEKVSLNFLRAVDRSRFDVRPILLVRPWEEQTYFAREIDKLGYRVELVPVAKGQSLDPFRVPRVARRLYQLLKRGEFDLVHTHGYFADICGLPAAACLGIRRLSTCHGFVDISGRLQLYNRLDRHAIKLCQKVIAVSDGLKESLVDCGVNDSRVVVIPNAVALPESAAGKDAVRDEKRQLLGIPPQEFVIGYVGRLSAEKGVGNLIEALAVLQRQGVRARLVIVGEGPERSALEQLVGAQAVTNSVTFAGFQTDIENWLSAFDVMVLPSLTEGTPLVVLEAMAAGVPVVASAVGGVPKVVTDGMNGFLVEAGNIHDLTRKVRALMENPGLAQAMIMKGIRTIAEQYGISQWCKRIEGLYAEV